MKRYARIQDGVIAELFETNRPIGFLFHPQIIWVELPVGSDAGLGWTFANEVFSKPQSTSVISTMTFSQVVAAIETLQRDVVDLKHIAHASGVSA